MDNSDCKYSDMPFAQAQREMASAIMRCLTSRQGMQSKWTDGRSMRKVASEFIKPNERLTSFERLEIYNRQYWFRLADSLSDDFPGLIKLMGQTKFDALITEYLLRYPSSSFTLRNLGSRLAEFLREEPQLAHPNEEMCQQMALFEWAKVVAFDGAAKPSLNVSRVEGLEPSTLRLHLQPYISLLCCNYAFDEYMSNEDTKEHTHQESGLVRTRGSKRCKTGLPGAERAFIAIHRFDNSVYFKRLEQEAFVLLSSISSGADLQTALEHTIATEYGAADGSLDLITKLPYWFSTWSELGWFVDDEICESDQMPAVFDGL